MLEGHIFQNIYSIFTPKFADLHTIYVVALVCQNRRELPGDPRLNEHGMALVNLPVGMV